MQKQFGNVQVTIFKVGEIRADLASWFGLESWPSEYDALLRQAVALPVQCVLVQTPGMTLLVDAYVYAISPESNFALPNYQPPPDLMAQMAAVSVQPEHVTDVVITHLHFDHYSGVTTARDGHFVPTFPQARLYIGRSDWQLAEKEFARPHSPESQTLAVLQEHDLQELVEGELVLGDKVKILPAPGESPGHQVVQVIASEHIIYILGDLYHHEVEVEQPQWIVTWADAAGMAASRQALLPELLDKQAVLIAAHIEGFGSLQQTAAGLIWQKTEN